MRKCIQPRHYVLHICARRKRHYKDLAPPRQPGSKPDTYAEHRLERHFLKKKNGLGLHLLSAFGSNSGGITVPARSAFMYIHEVAVHSKSCRAPR